MEELNAHSFALIDNERIALVCIEGNWPVEGMLSYIAARIRRNVRRTDVLLIGGNYCLVTLLETPIEGAQVVARRLHALLADVEHTLQIVSGLAAQNMVQMLYRDQPFFIVGNEAEATLTTQAEHGQSTDHLPYLAFLASYPSHRLLHLIPYDLARHYHCVPVGVERGVLTLATCQRLEREAVERFEEVTQKTIFLVRCEAGLIEDVLRYWQAMV